MALDAECVGVRPIRIRHGMKSNIGSPAPNLLHRTAELSVVDSARVILVADRIQTQAAQKSEVEAYAK